MSSDKTIIIRQGKLKQALLEQLKRTPTIEQSCQKVGVSRMTVYRWMKSNHRFAQDVENALREGRDLVSDIAETKMFSLIGEGKTEMIKYFLTHNNPRYSNKLELSGTVGARDIPLTKEQKNIIKKALRLSSLHKYENYKKESKTNRENIEG
ncbi:MAG: hypothetical protein Q8P56_07045 [Candidatus Uhrbacteria bacterium]|nr:hypothetical protein [Candidatus Uhrbacteria bacterium]